MTPFKEHLLVRAIMTGLGIVVGLVGVWSFTEENLSLLGALFFIGVLAVPFAGYLLLLRTREASWAIGAVLVALVLLVQLMAESASEAGSSTAPLAYFWFPLIGSAIVGAVGLAEWWRH